MRKNHSLQYILIFILAQIAWLSLLGLWIYWYVSNYTVSANSNVIALVGGLILLVAVSLAMSLIFARLSIQLKITRLYDTFIANVTHELKSPLASIQLYLETLNERRISNQKQKQFVRLMIHDARRLNSLINSILEIAGHEQKKVAHHFEVYEADSTLRSLIKEAADQFKLPRNAVRIIGAAACQFVVDQNALKIVVNNIFDNAIKYSPGKPTIGVHVKRLSGNLIIEFRDRGIGISVEDQKKVFNKFHRIYNQDIPNVKGTGLGLYWVREIVKYHGGRVSVFSEGKNKGSTFRIQLPIYRAGRKSPMDRLLKITRREQAPSDVNKRGNGV